MEESQLVIFLTNLTSWIASNLIVALVAGFATGVTASIVVARRAKFEELRSEARRIIWGIEWIYAGNSKPQIIVRRHVGDLVHISSEFFVLKHTAAGHAIAQVQEEITSTLYAVPEDVIDMASKHTKWQRICREIKPDRKVIFKISWKL